MKTRSIVRLAPVVLAAALFAGCGGPQQPSPPPAESSTIPRPTQQSPTPRSTPSNLGVDCNGKPNEDIGAWQDYLAGRIDPGRCSFEANGLEISLTDIEFKSGAFEIVVRPLIDQDDPASGAGHEVSISNVEIQAENYTVSQMADRVRTDGQASSVTQYLANAQAGFEKNKIWWSMVWQQEFGKDPTFEDLWMPYSPDGNSFQIAPKVTAQTCPSCGDTFYDGPRSVWFEFDNDGGVTRAIKFDLTIDGETHTLAFSTLPFGYPR